jgi:hypothetical protein
MRKMVCTRHCHVSEEHVVYTSGLEEYAKQIELLLFNPEDGVSQARNQHEAGSKQISA